MKKYLHVILVTYGTVTARHKNFPPMNRRRVHTAQTRNGDRHALIYFSADLLVCVAKTDPSELMTVGLTTRDISPEQYDSWSVWCNANMHLQNEDEYFSTDVKVKAAMLLKA